MINTVMDEWGQCKIDGLLEDGTKIITVGLAIITKLLTSVFGLGSLISRGISIFHSMRSLITKLFSLVVNLKERTSRIIISFFNVLQLVPKVTSFKFNTKISISRVLSSKFGIGAIISKLLSFLYSLIGFYIIEVTCTPYTVHRAEVESWSLRCDWYDEADLDASYYKCEFWIRDEQNNIYGPYNGTITKEAAKEYHAIYELDPDETFLLGLYDVKVEVTKYA